MTRLGDFQEIAISLIQILNSIIQVACETKKTCKIEEFSEMVVVTVVIYFITTFAEAALRPNDDSNCDDSNYERIVGNIQLLAGSLTVVLLVLIIDIPYFGDLLLGLWICVFIWLIWNSHEELIGLLRQTFHFLSRLKELASSLRRSEATNHVPRDENELAHGTTDEGDVEQPPISRLGDFKEIAISLAQILNSIIQVACETKKTCKIEKFSDTVVITVVIYFIASFAEAALHPDDDSNRDDSNYERIVRNIQLLAGSLTVVLLVLIINIPYFGDLLLGLWICAFIWLIWSSYEELIGLLRQTFNLLKNRGGDALRRLKELASSLCRTEATIHVPRDENELAHGTTDEGDAEQPTISRS